MTAEYEIHSFVNKFMNLSRNGEKADLSLNCEHGRIVVNLQLHLRQGPPAPFHPYPAPRSQPRPYHHPSPSRLRRSERRRKQAEQAVASDKTEKVSSYPINANDKAEKVLEVESTAIPVPAEEAVSVLKVAEDNDAKEAFEKIDDHDTQFQQSGADTAEQAGFPTDDKVTKSIHNKSEGTYSHQQPKPLLVCNYCNEGFENEVLIRDHTEIVHKSGRIRYRLT